MKEAEDKLIKKINDSINKTIKENNLNTREIHRILIEIIESSIEAYLRFCKLNSTSENYKALKIRLVEELEKTVIDFDLKENNE